MQIVTRPGTALAIGALALSAACGPAFTTTCRVDRDCPVAQRCDLQQSVCVAAGVDAGDAAIADRKAPERGPADVTTEVSADVTASDGAPVDALWSDVHPFDTRLPDTHETDASVPDAAADANHADTERPDADAPDTSGPDTRAQDTRVPDTRLADTRMPDNRLPDTRLPDNRLPDTRSPDTHLPDANLPDAAATDRGTGVDVPCPAGCVDNVVCYSLGQSPPSNPCIRCSWQSSTGFTWSNLTHLVCVGLDSCQCTSGVLGSCTTCDHGCLNLSGVCCGERNQPCCPGDLCYTGVCTISGWCDNRCGNLGDECCANEFFQCNSAGLSCCCQRCISATSYCELPCAI